LKFRDYQEEIIDKAVDVLQEHRFVYLAMEVRTGKTLRKKPLVLYKMTTIN